MLTQHTTAAALLARFREVRSATMDFCRPLTPEDLMVQSCPEASPVKWHLAHTSWFFETFVLREFLAAYQPFDPNFLWLFNSYYKSLGEMPEKKLRASFSRPPLDQILAYRETVDAGIAHLLDKMPEDEALRRIALGLEHEQQHLELIATDIKHALFTNPLHPAYLQPETANFEARLEAMAPPLDWVTFSPGYPARPGVVEIGITPDPAATDNFAFDNETPRHSVYVAPFRLASRLVTCAEYLAFIEEDGYSRPELWLSEGWDIMRAEGWQSPLYWHRDASAKSGWSVYTLHGFQPLGELSETPVCHLSFFEADAFARWSGYRLPTEFEWEFAAAQQQPSGNLLETTALHPTAARPVAGLQQMFGDVWEWTQSPYTGYPGYRPLPGALGEYNGKFMSSQIVLRGGSCVTPQTHIRATYRNFFSPGTRWQFSGLRLARDGASLTYIPVISTEARSAQRRDRSISLLSLLLLLSVFRCHPERSQEPLHPHNPYFGTHTKPMPTATSTIQEAALNEAVLSEALTGLTASPKTLSPWLFYDERGSQLFEQITQLPEYYLTRTERAIFAEHAHAILESASQGARLTLMELGAGTATKTGLLLEATVTRQGSVVYQPIDVSASALDEAAASIAANIPGVIVESQVANYTSEPFTLSRLPGERALALYIGSSIGNFSPSDATNVLRNLRDHLAPGDSLLLGTDLAPGPHKSIESLEAAYDDAEGVTGAFNLNVLHRLNRDLGADFHVDRFAHRALWNAAESRIEMHLESLAAQTVHVGDRRIKFAAGETIHTENSHKFTEESIAVLLNTSGFISTSTWHDSDHRFAVTLAAAI